MAVSISIVDRFKYGNAMTVVADVTWDSSYPTGGESVSAASFGLAGIQHIFPFVGKSTAGAYLGRWDGSKTSPKLLLYAYDTTLGGASDAAALTYTDPAAITASAPDAITGGESPTEAEHNAVITQIGNLITDVTAIRTKLIAAGVDLGVIRTSLVALTGTKTGSLGEVPDTTNLASPQVTSRITVVGF